MFNFTAQQNAREDALAAYEQGFNAEQLAAGDAFFKSVNIPFAQSLHHVTPV